MGDSDTPRRVRGFLVAAPAAGKGYSRPMMRGQSLRMLAGLAVGVTCGIVAHVVAGSSPALERFVSLVTDPGGRLFLRLLFVLVVPLVVSSLALGVSGLGDLRALGRIGLKTLAYTVVVSTIAVLLGVGLVNALR